jgi:hypothetical protein
MSETWVTMASFFAPPQPQPDFEAALSAEAERFFEAAKEAGLPPEANVRISRGDTEVHVDVSPALFAAFSPQQTLWKAE